MTLGPTLVLLAIFERRQARHDLLSRLLIVFGRVPLFFYLLHLYVIHGLVIVFVVAMNRDTEPFLASFDAFPSWWGFGLPAVYLVWVGVTLLLYPLCRWFARSRRATRTAGGLRTYKNGLNSGLRTTHLLHDLSPISI